MKNYFFNVLTKKFSRTFLVALFAGIMVMQVNEVQAKRIYVRSGGSDNSFGNDWYWAYATIGKAMQMADASTGDEIWVEKGTYLPTLDETLTIPIYGHLQRRTFFIKSGVKIYGGFAGTETNLSQRVNYAPGQVNETILSGETTPYIDPFYKSFHVVYLLNASAQTAVDGFTIHYGNYRKDAYETDDPALSGVGTGIINLADGAGVIAAPVFNNCTIEWNTAYGAGGGVYNSAINGAQNSPKFTNCTIKNNSAVSVGGAICNYTSNPEMTNCSITDNQAAQGGAIYSEAGSNMSLTQCIIKKNLTSSLASIMNVNSVLTFTNCIITEHTNLQNVNNGGITNDGATSIFNFVNSIYWNNWNPIDNIADLNGAVSNISYSLVKGNNDVANFNINATTTPPVFIGTNNYRFALGSPGIDAGNNAANIQTTDIVGNIRIQNSIIDMGPYEGVYPLCPDTTFQTLSGCPGYSVTVGTNTYDSTGVYTDATITSIGCDSIVRTTLTIYPAPATTQTFTECSGFSVIVGTHTYTTTGNYSDTLTTIHGCDSIINTNLTINSLPDYVGTALPVNICSGSTVTLEAKNGPFLSGSTNYRGNMPAITELSQKITFEAMISRNSNYMYIVSNWPEVFSVSNQSFFGNDYLEFKVSGFFGRYPIMPNSNWIHVAFVFDGTGATDADVLKVYYDGVEQTALSFAGTAPTSLTLSGISRLCEGGGTKIQNCRIWNIARTQAEIVSTMNTSLVGNEPGLIVNYLFNEHLHYTTAGMQYLSSNTSFNYPLELYGDSTKYWPNNLYAWSDGVTNGVAFNPTVSHDYVVTITNITTTCSTTDTAHVVISASVPVITNSALTFCSGTGVTLSTGAYASYNWLHNDGDGGWFVLGNTQSININNYNSPLIVEVVDSNGCTGTSLDFTENFTSFANEPVSITIADVTDAPINIATGGTASASSSYYNVTDPDRAFDGDLLTDWGGDGVNNLPDWLEYDLGAGNAQSINAYSIYIGGADWGYNYMPTAWIFEGFNGTAWDTLDVQTAVSLTPDTYNIFPISSTVSYQRYRLYITAGMNTNYANITELALLKNVVPSCINKTFIAATIGINLTYQWFVNGIASGIDSSLYNSSTLNYHDNVSCVLTSTYQCAGTNNPATSNTVLVEGPSISPVITGALSYCAGSTTALDAGTYSTYLWSNSATSQTIPATAGTYSVAVTNGLCSGTSANVVVTENANPTVAITGTLSYCTGANTTLDAGTHTSYLWSNNATSQTINATAGTYTVSVTNANGCTGISANVVVTENTNPTATITGSLSFCAGTNTTLDAGSFTSYLWSTGATTQTLVATTANNPITVTVTNSNGCTGTSASVNVVESSALSPIITGTLSYCQGSNTTLNAGIFSTYLWSNGATTQTINATAGTYSVYVTDGFCNGTSANVVVTENTMPVVNIGANNTLCSNYGDIAVLDAGNAGMSYMWNDNTTAQTLTVNSTFMTSGIYNYSVTVTNGACSSSDAIVLTVEICSGIAENLNIMNVSVYPNPTTDKVYIKSDKTLQIKIYNAIGDLVFTGNTKVCDYVSLKQNGVYLFEISTDKNKIYKKIVVQ